MGLFSKKKLELPPVPDSPAAPPSELPEIKLPPLDLPELAPSDILPVPEKVADKTLEEPAPPVNESIAPVFVAVEDYQAVLDGVNLMKTLLGQAEEQVKALQAVKHEQERELEAWRSQLEDIERKLSYVDEVLFQAE